MSAADNKAVFLSYASQDAEAVERIAVALRASGIEVWFDKNELVGGDAWDQKIRRQIKECALFVPVISANTNARAEGYFRLEWKLAVDRSHLMADDAPFLFPVVIDDTTDAAARVPDRFREVQWTRLSVKDTPESLATRVAKILSPAEEPDRTRPARRAETTRTPERKSSPLWLRHAWIGLGLIMGLVYAIKPLFNSGKPRDAKPRTAEASPAPAPAVPKVSEARQLADRAFALSVDKYDSSLDDYTLAESLMQKALALDASDGEILARSAQLQVMFRNRGFDYGPERIARGREQAERAIRLVPESPEAVYALALAQRYTGNRDASTESLERVIALAPNHARALLMLGSILIGQGKSEEGLALYARARQQPEWAPLADYFEFLRQLGRRNLLEADRLVRSSYRAGPSANNVAGIALIHLTGDGDLEAAARELAEIPVKLRTAPRVVAVTAFVHLSRRKPEEALKALDRLPDEFIQDAWSTGPKAALVGRAHALAGRDTAARLAWEAGLAVVDARLKAAPGDTGIHHSRGMLLAWLNRPDEALQEARTVQELSRGVASTWNISEATIYAALGRSDLAVPLLAAQLKEQSGRVNWPLTVTLLRHDSLWDKIRDDPGFKQLLEEAKAEPKSLTQSPGDSSGAKPDAKSVVVLPFVNQSADKDNEYFSDGIAEELLTVLQKIPGLKVAARTSAWSFKGKNVTLKEVGETLGMAHVVEGSVQKSGNKVKITARLSRAATNEEVWSKSFGPLELTDVFATQSEIAQNIVTELRGRLVGDAAATEIQAQVQAARKGGTKNAEAHQLYLQGKFFLNKFTLDEVKRALGYFERALALDAKFALAWAALADAHNYLGGFSVRSDENAQGFGAAREAAQRALTLEPELADALRVLADSKMARDFDWKGARQLLDRALQLAPTDPAILASAAALAWSIGRIEQATSLNRQAVTLDPVNPLFRINLGFNLNALGQFQEAETEFLRVIDLSPKAPWSYSGLGVCFALQGRFAEAEAAARQDSVEWARLTALALIQWGKKSRAEADATLGQLIATVGDVAAFQIAEAYAFRQDNDRAFEWLERALRQRDPGLAGAKADPLFRSLHADPRWPSFLRKLGLHDDQLK